MDPGAGGAVPGDASWDARDSRILSRVATVSPGSCWPLAGLGVGRVSSLSQLRSSTLPCPRRLVSGDVHPPRSDAVQTALGTSPLLSQPVSSCVKLTAMTLAVVFLNLSEPGAEPGPRATALLAQRYGVVRTQGWPTWVHFLALLLPCLAV